MVFATVSSKGQITLPISARRALGIKEYDKVCIETEKDRITIKSVPNILSYSGSVGKASSLIQEKRALKNYFAKRQSAKK